MKPKYPGCMTFTQLLRRHNIESIDLLQIDIEGYELELLKTIDFSATPIRFVNYECVLLHDNKGKAEQLMRNNGYLSIEYGQDAFCYKRSDKDLI